MHIFINKVVVTISQETIDAVLEHSVFCSAGTEWLVRNDPCCDLEREYIEQIQDCLRRDVEQTIQGFTLNEQDDFWDEVDFLNEDHDECVRDLIDLVTSKNT